MMTRQSMARVSSASTEVDFAPGMVPFDWEAPLGRPGRKSSSIKAGRGSLDVPSLPLPPGRVRPEDSPDLQTGRAPSSSRPRKLFNLKLPGFSKKAKEEEDSRFSIFNPVSGSSITRRLLESLTKKQSLWKRCLPSAVPRQMRPEHQSKGRRLDSVDEENADFEGDSLSSSPGHGLSSSSPVVTKHVQPSSNSSPQTTLFQPASPGHGHRNSSPKQFLQPSSPGYGRRQSSNSSPRQLLQPSSPSYGDSRNSSPVVTKQVQVASSRFMASMLISLCPEDVEPRFDAEDEVADNRSSSPQVLYETPQKPSECAEIVVDPASETVPSHEECRCTCKHRAQVDPRENITSRKVSRSLHEELATAQTSSPSLRSGKKHAQHAVIVDQSNTDAYPVFRKVSAVRMEPYQSTFSWKSCTEMSLEPVADSDQDRGDCEFAKEIFEVDTPRERSYERRGGFSGNSSSSSESNTSRPNPSNRKSITPKSKLCGAGAPLSMVGFLSPPRASSGESEHSSNKPKTSVRWMSAVEPRKLSSPEGRAARIQKPAARATASFLSPPRSKTRTKQTQIKSQIAHHGDDDTDESDSDCSTDSSENNRVARSAANFASSKPAKSQSLFKFQQSHREPTLPEAVTALPGPSFKQVLMARSHSVRSSSSRVFPPQECDLPPASRLAKTSSSIVMSKVVEWEARAGVRSSGKSAPLYRINQRAVSTTRP